MAIVSRLSASAMRRLSASAMRRAGRALGVAALALVLVLTPSPNLSVARAGAGGLDPSFGAEGKVTTEFGVDIAQSNALAVQPDGKVILAGHLGKRVDQNHVAYDFGVARYTAEGRLDAAFGGGGKVVMDFGGDEIATAVAVQQDGKIVVAGLAYQGRRPVRCNQGCEGPYATASHFAVARFNPDGSPDASFGSGGRTTTGFEGGYDGAYALAILPDGKLLLAGSAVGKETQSDFAVARFNPDGSLDESFGSGGKATADFFGFVDRGLALAMQPDGKIAVAGFAAVSNYTTTFGLVRFNADGSLDRGFHGDGKVTPTLGAQLVGPEQAKGVAVQPDGKIVAVGRVADGITSDYLLARCNPDGSLDETFGQRGVVVTKVGVREALPNELNAVVVLPDGRLVVAGGAYTRADEAGAAGPKEDFALLRYGPDGKPDETFGDGGKLVTDFGGREWAYALVVLPDGKLLLAGTGADGKAFALARYAA